MNVAIIYGGPSYEHNVSLRSGRSILESLPEHMDGVPVLVGYDGRWYEEGRPSDPERVSRKADVVFNAMHGAYGEDGKVQQLLELHSLPYIGSGPLASAHAMNKQYTRELLKQNDIYVPRGILLNAHSESVENMARRVFVSIGLPVVVKPNIGGSSLGVSAVINYEELPRTLERAMHFGPSILVEEYIRGREASCGVLEDFRGEDLYALPPIEGGHCPSQFNRETKDKLQSIAQLLHNKLSCRHYSRTDFIVAEEPWRAGRVYALELDTLPGITSETLYTKEASAIGLEYTELIGHLASLALTNR